MKKHFHVLLLASGALSVFAGCAVAHRSTVALPVGAVMMFSGDVMGHQCESVVRWADVTNAPIWSASRGNPPVSVRDAARLAAKSMAESLGDLKGWSQGDITLHEWPGKGYWTYQIKFDGPAYTIPNSTLKSQSQATVVVLMNGQVFCPKPK